MKQRNILALGVLIVTVLVLAFFQTPFMESTRGRVWDWWVTVVARGGGLSGEESADEQAAVLRADNIRLKAELQDYRILRQQLASPSLDDWKSLPAMIVGRPIDTAHTGLALNRGLEDGVTVGAPVVTRDFLLVGVVETVQSQSSFVRTLLHPESQFSVMSVPEDIEAKAARGLLESRFRTSLHMVTIPRDLPIAEGENIVIDARNEDLPLGLVVGKVQAVDNPEHEAYQEARIELPYDLDELRAVSILLAP